MRAKYWVIRMEHSSHDLDLEYTKSLKSVGPWRMMTMVVSFAIQQQFWYKAQLEAADADFYG